MEDQQLNNEKEQEKSETLQEYHETILDSNEEKALKDIKNSLSLLTDPKDKGVIDPSILLNNDFLLHFLRARKLNIIKATKMILDYYNWKIKVNLDDIYSNYIYKEKLRLQLLFPHGFHKITKDGNPIYFQIMGLLDPDELFKISNHDELIRYSIQIFELLERNYFKICSKIKGSYIHGIFYVIDFNGINSSILNKNILAYIKEIIKISQDYFPETLAGGYVLNASFLFRALYNAVKIFLDEKTRDKIKVLGSDYKDILLEKIDSKNLPKFFGGECECPEGCLFSNAGPWKKIEKEEENISEDIFKRRIEITDILTSKLNS